MAHNTTEPRLTDRDIEGMISHSQTRSEKRRRPNAAVVWGSRLAVGAAAGTLLLLGLRGGHNNSAPSTGKPEGTQGNVPADTRAYLESRRTESATVPEGGGVDNAAYAVDDGEVHDGVRRGTYTETDDIHAGIKAILDEQVKRDTGGTIAQAGEQLNVPIVPPTDQVPPAAR